MPKAKAKPKKGKEVAKSTRARVAAIAKRQLQAGLEYRKPRIKQILELEAILDMRPRPTLKRRLSVPFDSVIFTGFKETLASKIDENIQGVFENFEKKDLLGARAIQAAWDFESDEARGDWNGVDLKTKKLAIISNVGFNKYMATSHEGEYQSILDSPDYLDMVTEPGGPSDDLDKHLFTYQQNIFRTKSDLKLGVKNGVYIADEVTKLIASRNAKMHKETQQQLQERVQRDQNAGLIGTSSNNFVGEDIYNLTEGVLRALGKEWYIFFDPETLSVIRLEKLTDVFANGEKPWTVWQIFSDPRRLWSLGPFDYLKPIAEIMRVVWSETLENMRRTNWNMAAVDARIFPDLNELKWRPDGLARADLSQGQVRSIKDGIYEFKIPQLGGITINLMSYLNSFLGEKTGITPGSQGNSEESKVGIHFSNLEQITDRIGLMSRGYRRAHIKLLKKYHDGLKEHLTEKMAVKIMGEKGLEAYELTQQGADIKLEYGIRGANEETRKSEVQMAKREKALANIATDPTLRAMTNPRWRLEEILRFGGYDEQEIKVAVDKERFGNAEMISKAEMAIDDILHGRQPKTVHEANSIFVQHILDWELENRDRLTPEKLKALLEYNEEHIDIAERNMIVEARKLSAGGGSQPAAPQPVESAVPSDEQVPPQVDVDPSPERAV